MVGITLHQYEALDSIYLRFIRADRAFHDIQKLLNHLTLPKVIHVSRDNSSSSQRDLAEQQTKRRKTKNLDEE